MFDAQFAFVPSALACAAGAEALKGDVYDAGTDLANDGTTYINQKPFAGYSRVAPRMFITGKVTGGAATIRCRLVGDANVGLDSGSPITLADTGTSASIAENGQFHFEVPVVGQTTAKRYYGLLVTVTGGGATATIVAGVKMQPQSNMPYVKQAVPA